MKNKKGETSSKSHDVTHSALVRRAIWIECRVCHKVSGRNPNSAKIQLMSSIVLLVTVFVRGRRDLSKKGLTSGQLLRNMH